MEDAASFGRLVDALRPWLGHLVIAGGWAHRLHQLHPLAHNPGHDPVRTRDVDLALSPRAPLAGDIGDALAAAGFTRTFLGEDAPPVTHYDLDDDAGFYAEFLAPLEGSEIRRDGTRDVTVSLAGITAQKLRHLDLLLFAPWSVRVGATDGEKSGTPRRRIVRHRHGHDSRSRTDTAGPIAITRGCPRHVRVWSE